MFVERKVCYSALLTNLVGWHAGAVSFPLSAVISAQLACPLSDAMFCLHSGIVNLSLYKHWVGTSLTNNENTHEKKFGKNKRSSLLQRNILYEKKGFIESFPLLQKLNLLGMT
jgi:hypothetical protein